MRFIRFKGTLVNIERIAHAEYEPNDPDGTLGGDSLLSLYFCGGECLHVAGEDADHVWHLLSSLSSELPLNSEVKP